MASLEKVKKFLKVSGTEETIVLWKKQFSVMTEQLFPEDKDLKKDHPKIHAELVNIMDKEKERVYKALTKKSKDLAAEFFSKNFSDKEIDELIAFYASPLWKRLLKLMPEYSARATLICLPIIKEAKDKLEIQLHKLEDKLDKEILENLNKERSKKLKK